MPVSEATETTPQNRPPRTPHSSMPPIGSAASQANGVLTTPSSVKHSSSRTVNAMPSVQCAASETDPVRQSTAGVRIRPNA